ncbi:FOG: Ankyrin repeat protein [Beutenbergia cavernae DSM 12333]|uniref:FOG: Ankyrin repeat protein n=1 Tax=Beutenbergia cavernae (strain ATCC BAA-8 / DSM 12333 / CCUG 43141 / JCM 11478 / NBRC 16432 / NCIMB 13614 / HKI 0122) TaxID=471853 RepID=C5C406_BEUC1|nr:ankyrin repeat domain-containing protein [Beutenbergia cavernae]ACQ79919.1 FOG: Ankyrin repeat protein [Beutenbergia cavernae DSM 12333]
MPCDSEVRTRAREPSTESRRRARLRRASLVAGCLAVIAVVAGCTAPGDGAEATDVPSAPNVTEPTTATEVPMPTTTRPAMSPEEATAALHAAVAADDVAGVTSAIEAGADLEARGAGGATALVVATKANRVAIARVLLEAGADPNATDDISDSAFLYAGAEGLDEILVMTLAHGADVTSTNRFGGTALIPASEHGHVETVRILIEAGVPVNHINNVPWTALHEAIVLGDGGPDQVEVVRLLLGAGADPTIPDGAGVPPRRLAADRGFDEIVALLDVALLTWDAPA